MNSLHQNHWKKRRFIFIPLILAAIFGFSALVMLLWNAIIPDVFHWSSISIWQAMGLLVLSRILFGGFHFRKPGWRKRGMDHPAFREKFMGMNEEEKAEFKEEWRRRCGK